MAGLVVQMKPEQKNHWVRYIKKRISLNKNMVGAITGPVGSGKSSSCLAIAELLDKNFTVDNVVFDLKGLMNLVNGKTLKPGSVIVYEEAGVSLNSKNWQSILSRVNSYLLQTWRHKNYILIYNLPYIDLLDSSTRKMLNFEWQTLKIDYKISKVILRPMIVQYNPKKQKYYEKYLRVRYPEGVEPLRKWGIPKPSKELWDIYEVKKDKFTTETNLDIMSEIERADEKINARKSAKGKKLTLKQEEAMKLMAKYSDAKIVAKEMGICVQGVYEHINLSEKKGYNPSDFLKNTSIKVD